MRGAFVQVESRMSLTGASADEWVPVKPGTEGVLALGLAHVILREQAAAGRRGGRAGARDRRLVGGPRRLHAGEVEQITGVAAERDRAAGARARRAAAVGRDHRRRAARAHQRAVHGARRQRAQRAARQRRAAGRPVLHAAGRPARPAAANVCARCRDILAADSRRAGAAARRRESGVRRAEGVEGARGARARFRSSSSFGSFVDDTSVLADLILPDHSFLESWVDARPESGAIDAVATVAGPAMKPLYQTRATADVLLDVAGKLKTPLALPWKTFDEMLQATSAQSRRPTPRRSRAGRLQGDRRKGRGTARSAATSLSRSRRAACSTATRRSIRSTSCRTPRRRFSTDRPRTCRGCRRCPIR